MQQLPLKQACLDGHCLYTKMCAIRIKKKDMNTNAFLMRFGTVVQTQKLCKIKIKVDYYNCETTFKLENRSDKY